MELPPIWEHHFRQLSLDEGSRKTTRRWIVFIALSIFAAGILVSYPTDSVKPYRIALAFFFAIITLASLRSAISPLIEVLPFARRNSMLELARLSGISPWHLWLSKAVVIHFHAFNLPFLAWPLVILCAACGMTPPSTILWMMFLSLLLVIFVSSAALAASARTEEDGLAYAAFLAILAFSGFLIPFAMNSILGGSLNWMLLSPFYGYYRGLHIDPLDAASLNLILTGMIGWPLILLVLSHLQLRQQEYTRYLPPRLETFAFRMLGRPMQPQHPFSQLVWREWKTALVAWTLIAIWMSGLIFLLLSYGLNWFKPIDFMLAALILSVLLKFLIKASTGRIAGETRRENILELVMTAGLKPTDILQGLHHGLRQLYWRHYCFGVLAFLILMLTGLTLRPFSNMELSTYLITWAWLFYLLYRSWAKLSMQTVWKSLNLGRPAYSIAKTWTPQIGGSLYVCFLLFGKKGFLGYSTLSQFPFGNYLEFSLVIVSSLAIALCIYYDTDESAQMIVEHLPEIAASPVPDPSDERIATWDESQPFHVRDPEAKEQ